MKCRKVRIYESLVYKGLPNSVDLDEMTSVALDMGIHVTWLLLINLLQCIYSLRYEIE